MPSINSLYTNLQTYNPSQTTKTSSNLNTSAFSAALNSVSEADSKYTVSTKYGFKADENGFLDPLFNELAGIPSNVKINVKTVDMTVNYAKNEKMNLDPISAMSKAWSFFSTLNSGTNLGNGKLSVSQLASMPESALSSNGTIFGILFLNKIM